MKRRNVAKDKFLERLPNILIESIKSDLQNNLSFSFKYFDNSQKAGQDFADWSHEQLIKLLNKLKHYTGNTIKYWQQQKIGSKRQSILEIYGDFPRRSQFTHPKHIPIDVHWARFRLEGDMRLIGFVIPEEECCKHELFQNIFYIVFLDQYHKFHLKN